jgi:quinolinate synthase
VDTTHQRLIDEIAALRRAKNATILAHVYAPLEVQEVADFVGDSLGLSQRAALTGPTHRVIVFCGVHFMAETAALLSPGRKVLLPDPSAGCPMADMVSAEEVRTLRSEHPGAMVVCYVNSTVAVKAESDVCVTSSNAVKVVKSLPCDEVIFVPDQNLGMYVQSRVPRKRFVVWPGYCTVHRAIRPMHVEAARAAHPEAVVLAHPECTPDVLAMADFVGSTGQMRTFARQSKGTAFIIATENGLIDRLAADNPGKGFYPATELSVCPNMKKISLRKVRDVLAHEGNVVSVPRELQEKALASITRMLDLS